VDRRERRCLDAEIELLRRNILLAGDRGDHASVPTREDTLQHLCDLRRADQEGDLLMYRSPSKAVHDVLELIRGPVEVRIKAIGRRKKSPKPWVPPDGSRGAGASGAPSSPGMAKSLLRKKRR
jgi:hypothetical protein